MSAIRRAKIYARERTPLQEVLPLSAPFAIQIDVCSACNLKCNFCFHSDMETIKKSNVTFGAMSLELFQKIIDDIVSCWGKQKIKKLRLFKIGEPLMNPKIAQMAAYAKKAEAAECIEITTNGTLLNETLSLELIEAGLDILNISVNGINEQQYKDVCQYEMDFQDFYKKIEFFYKNKQNCKIFIKYSDIGYTETEKQNFYQTFEKVSDEIFVETISSTLWQDTNIGAKINNAHKGTYGQELQPKEVCPFLFTTMVINHSGIAHLCCVDWKTEYILGDLKTEKIADIWNGEKLCQYQKLHLKKRKDDIPICRHCESLSANTTDDIDSYADIILKRMEQ